MSIFEDGPLGRDANGVWDIEKKIKSKRVNYVWQAADVTNGWAVIPVVFDTPFEDTNYTAVFTPHDKDIAIGLDYYNGDYHDKTAAGFTAIVYAFSPGPDFSHAGDHVEVNVLAIHD